MIATDGRSFGRLFIPKLAKKQTDGFGEDEGTVTSLEAGSWKMDRWIRGPGMTSSDVRLIDNKRHVGPIFFSSFDFKNFVSGEARFKFQHPSTRQVEGC
jgi:hypothetical protein